ncbi:MAG: Trk family potassium uptake protein, partial [Clostridia bacterium]|nr:Trk family potassium uptake protein [Clostridia bacterium]
MAEEKKKFKILTPVRVIAIGFALIIFVGAFFLCLPIAHNDGQWFSFMDALFTSTSAVCVTGLIVVDTATHFNLFGQMVILLLIQIGGLGVMTATTLLFLMMRKRITLKNRLMLQEALSEDRLQGIVKSIKLILILTFSIELVGALILMCSFIPAYGGYGVWVSIFISVSAFCNAGFDILGVVGGKEFGSLTAFAENAFVCLPVMALIVIGGIGFMVLIDMGDRVAKKKKRLLPHTKMVLVITAILIVFGWAAFMATEWNGVLKDMSVGGKILSALFQSVTPRTAGFETVSQGALTPVSYMLTLILMFIGASPSSTGGGVKTTTLAVLMLTGIRTLQGERDINLGRTKINPNLIKRAITIIMLAMMIIMLNTILILIFEGNNHNTAANVENILFEVTSAFATVGLTMGITSKLCVASKLL